MGRKQRLKELTIKDNFMFGAVMMDEDNCKGLLERVLELPIERVEISREKSIVYHPEYKGVRLDVYAKDESQTRYNVEMQVEKKPALGKRSRYYQSQMDMEMLLAGEDAQEITQNFQILMSFLYATLTHLERASIAIRFKPHVENLRKQTWKTVEQLCS